MIPLESSQLYDADPAKALGLWTDGWRPMLAEQLTPGQRALSAALLFHVPIPGFPLAAVTVTEPPELRDGYGRLWVTTSEGVIETTVGTEVWTRSFR